MRKTLTLLFQSLIMFALLLQASLLRAQTADTTQKANTDTIQQVNSPLLKHSPIKTLTDAQYTAMLRSDDINNTAAPATKNYYPLPEKVLKYKKALKLTPEQLKKFGAIVATLKMKKEEVAMSMISNERTLDSLFRTRGINQGTILFYGQRYGAYQGELRIALLMACLESRKVLTPMQMNKFYALEKAN